MQYKQLCLLCAAIRRSTALKAQHILHRLTLLQALGHLVAQLLVPPALLGQPQQAQQQQLLLTAVSAQLAGVVWTI